MKSWAALSLLGLCCSSALGQQPSPLNSVIEVLNDMVAKVEKDAAAELEAYRKFTDWCDETAMNSDHTVADAKKQKEKLEAEIQQDKSEMEVAQAKVEDLAASTATAEKEMASAKAVRQKEVVDFKASESELTDMLEALGKALKILEKGGAALAQVDATNMNSMVQALGAMLDAASFPTNDRSKLLALVQAKAGAQDEAEAEAEVGAPNPGAYQSKSGNAVELMENLKDEADAQLNKLRLDETEAKGHYDLLMQSLKQRIEDNAKGMKAQKGDESEAAEHKAEDKGDLKVTAKSLEESAKELKTIQHTCLTSAADHDTTVASRKEELTTLAKAIEILQKVAEGGASFVQVESKAAASFSRSQVAPMVKRLAKQHHSAALAQLASRIAATFRSGEAGPFDKVRGLIKNMVVKLEDRATSEAKEKEYCDTEIKKATEKDESLEANLDEMTSTIDSSASNSAELKERLKKDEADLAALSKEQADLDQLRAKEHEDYTTEKADLELALRGIGQALDLLREYYGSGEEAPAETPAMLQQDADSDSFMQQPAPPAKHSRQQGAGGSLIQVIEQIESDFAANLAKVETQEADAQSDYGKLTGENKVEKATKEAEVKLLTKRLKRLETRMTESAEDKESYDAELAAVESYMSKLKEKCIAKPPSSEERAKMREEEVEGLKEALHVLEEESAAFLQHGRRSRRSLRAHPALL